jgi:hypothetical protein
MAEKTPSEKIDDRIAELGDWRGDTLSRVRELVHQADPDVVEDWKWRGVPTWYSHGRLVATGESYKDKIKVTFHRGAALDDETGLFNSSLDGGTRRAVDFSEGDEVPVDAFTNLYKQACDQARTAAT